MIKKRAKKAVPYIVLTIASIISIFPLLYMFTSATNASVDIIRGKLTPGTYLIENFRNLVAGRNVGAAMWNSFKYALLLAVLSLLVCSLAGYGFEIYHDRAKDLTMSILLLAMMVPFVATMVPLFQMFSKAKLLNTALGFVLPTISTPFMIMFFRNSARAFPVDIIEAAKIDGLNAVQIFFYMFVPTMKSTFAAAATIVFMNGWNNYLWPRVIMLTDDSLTMPMLVTNLTAGYVTDYGMLMLGVSICTLPTVIVFLVLQRSFAEGITGTVK